MGDFLMALHCPLHYHLNLVVFVPGSCRKLLLCGMGACESFKTMEDQHVPYEGVGVKTELLKEV
jgi:hypothetical protein